MPNTCLKIRHWMVSEMTQSQSWNETKEEKKDVALYILCF